MKAVVKRIALPENGRTICISDIHGHVELFGKLLDKVGYTNNDTLILLGDLYTKGPHPLETLRMIMGLSQNPNVHVLRGNCDWIEEALSPAQTEWLRALPHIIETDEFLFVHGGLPSEDLGSLDAFACMKNDAFMEKGLSFSRWVVTGHWPVANYCRTIPDNNPIVNDVQRIIAIDGGCVIRDCGQLNALLIQDGEFTFESADMLPLVSVGAPQEERGGFNIVWTERFVEILEHGEEFSSVRHILTGTVLTLPNDYLWQDGDGHWCGCRNGTDYFLPLCAGETVSLVRDFSDRMLVKKDGVVGWVLK